MACKQLKIFTTSTIHYRHASKYVIDNNSRLAVLIWHVITSQPGEIFGQSSCSGAISFKEPHVLIPLVGPSRLAGGRLWSNTNKPDGWYGIYLAQSIFIVCILSFFDSHQASSCQCYRDMMVGLTRALALLAFGGTVQASPCKSPPQLDNLFKPAILLSQLSYFLMCF